MNLDNLVNNITRKDEHDPKALELQKFITDSIEKYCESSIRWQEAWSVSQEDKDLLIRHGYWLENRKADRGLTYCYEYKNYAFICFDANGVCKSDKRMMSAGEMYQFYLKVLAKKQEKEREETKKRAYETFNGPSKSTIETPTHYVKRYHYYGDIYLNIYMEVVNEVLGKIPRSSYNVDYSEKDILLYIPKTL